MHKENAAIVAEKRLLQGWGGGSAGGIEEVMVLRSIVVTDLGLTRKVLRAALDLMSSATEARSASTASKAEDLAAALYKACA